MLAPSRRRGRACRCAVRARVRSRSHSASAPGAPRRRGASSSSSSRRGPSPARSARPCASRATSPMPASEGHVRFSVWNETGIVEAVVSLAEADAARLADFVRDSAPGRARDRRRPLRCCPACARLHAATAAAALRRPGGDAHRAVTALASRSRDGRRRGLAAHGREDGRDDERRTDDRGGIEALAEQHRARAARRPPGSRTGG